MVRESEVTPFASQRAVIRAGKPSHDELDWVLYVIWKEMRLPRSRSIFITSQFMSMPG